VHYPQGKLAVISNNKNYERLKMDAARSTSTEKSSGSAGILKGKFCVRHERKEGN
jgi:hypothetical protein